MNVPNGNKPHPNAFFCPTCQLRLRNARDAVLNSPEDIGYDMPKEIFDAISKIFDRDAKLGDLTKEIQKAEYQAFRCLTIREIKEHMIPDDDLMENSERIEGTLRLTVKWLKNKLASAGIALEDPSVLADEDSVVYQNTCEAYFTKLPDGTLLPDYILNSNLAKSSKNRRCAKCGRLLSPDTGKAPELRILLQGNSRAAKTSCIIAQIRWLEKMGKDPRSGIRFSLPKAGDRWLEEQLEKYLKGYKVVKTNIAQKVPGTFSVKVTINGRDLVITWVDMPGEYFQAPIDDMDQLLLQYRPIYKLCSTVWTFIQYEVLADRDFTPEEISRMVDRTGLEQDQYEAVCEAYRERFDDIRRGIHTELPPHAVILTKTDSIDCYEDADTLSQHYIYPYTAGAVNTETPASSDRKHLMLTTTQGGKTTLALDEMCFKTISSNVSAFFESTQRDRYNNLLTSLNQFSKDVCYFAQSAYGHKAIRAEEKGKADAPVPYNVHLPLLWTLALEGFIPLTFEVQLEKHQWFHTFYEVQTVSRKFDRKDACLVNNLLTTNAYKTHAESN